MSDKRGYGAGLTKSRDAARRGNLAAVLQISEEGVGQLAEAKIIAIARIEANPEQPRRAFDPATLAEMADSIRARGVLQPIRVRRHGDAFQIIAGERRFRAAQLAGLHELPAVVVEGDDASAYLDAVIENIQREDLNPLDRAEALRRLRVNLGLQSWEEVGRVLGMSRQSVYNLLGLTELPPVVQEDIRSGGLTEKHGRALRQLKRDPALQTVAYQQIVEEGLSGDQSLALARDLRQAKHLDSVSAPSPLFATLREIERWVDRLDRDLDDRLSMADRRRARLVLERAGSRLEAALSRLSE
jgi:ParB family transcriptional regulator, chromosome partitioning protein